MKHKSLPTDRMHARKKRKGSAKWKLCAASLFLAVLAAFALHKKLYASPVLMADWMNEQDHEQDITVSQQNAVVAGSDPNDDWQLVLVNATHPLENPVPPELKKLEDGHAVDARIYTPLTELLDAAQKEGLSILVCSAYRTQQTQEELFENKVTYWQEQGSSREAAECLAGEYVAMPGTSEHQLGLAVDLVSASNQMLDETQAETPEQKWLMEHCWEYGFILRYPTDKSDITGISYEPWHYRYVGKTHAAEIRRQGVCLEEYLEQVYE